jgi:flagellar protein FlbD
LKKSVRRPMKGLEPAMIALHRLAHPDEPFHVNPDLIVFVEAHPDTVVTLTTGAKVVVMEAPAEIAEAVLAWRSGILKAAVRDLPRRSGALTLVRGAAGDERGTQP